MICSPSRKKAFLHTRHHKQPFPFPTADPVHFSVLNRIIRVSAGQNRFHAAVPAVWFDLAVLDILVGMFKLVGRNIVRCIHFHGAKFVHAECGRVAVGISFSGTLLYEKNRSSVEKEHRNDDNQHHGTGWNAAKNAKDDIQQPLSITAVKIVQRKPLLSLFCSE